MRYEVPFPVENLCRDMAQLHLLPWRLLSFPIQSPSSSSHRPLRCATSGGNGYYLRIILPIKFHICYSCYFKFSAMLYQIRHLSNFSKIYLWQGNLNMIKGKKGVKLTEPIATVYSSKFAFLTGAAGNFQKARGPIIAEISLDKIRRPLARTRTNDSEKVKALMESIAEIGLQEPVRFFKSLDN